MIEQGAFITGDIILDSITIVIVSILISIIGLFVTKWIATRENLNESYKPAIILNMLWLGVNIIFYTIFNFIAYGIFLAFIISFLIHIFIGSFLASKLYKQEYIVSLLFIIRILVYLLIIGLIVGFIITIIISLIIIGLTVV